MIDSLDTMYLMGLTEYWDEAMGYIHELDFSIPSVRFYLVLCHAILTKQL